MPKHGCLLDIFFFTFYLGILIALDEPAADLPGVRTSLTEREDAYDAGSLNPEESSQEGHKDTKGKVYYSRHNYAK